MEQELLKEEVKEQTPEPKCTLGSEQACRTAKINECHCACGGVNHQKEKING